MRHYEVTLILDPSLEDKDAEAIASHKFRFSRLWRGCDSLPSTPSTRGSQQVERVKPVDGGVDM